MPGRLSNTTTKNIKIGWSFWFMGDNFRAGNKEVVFEAGVPQSGTIGTIDLPDMKHELLYDYDGTILKVWPADHGDYN